MNKAFEKILERLEEAIKECKELQRNTDDAYGYMKMKKGLVCAKGIVEEVSEEYNNSQINQLAMMYATSLMLYGVDVTKELETATQQSYALEQAYIRGRQCERDKFTELRKEYNNGWIPCSERLPEENQEVILQDFYGNITIGKMKITDGIEGFSDGDWWASANNYVAWQKLPEPFKERD